MGWFDRHRRWVEAYRHPAWVVVRDGTQVAVLTEPEFEDMFWFWWKVEPQSDEPMARAEVLSSSFWSIDLLPRTKFISRAFGHEAAAFWGGTGIKDGRVLMRGLYQGVPARWWDRLIVRVLLSIS